jgi:hypothetical protein
MNKLIIESIENQMCLEFIYDGERCIIEPYAFGISKKLLDTVVGFQIIGESYSLKPFGWKQFDAFKILEMNISKTPFKLPAREGFEREIKELKKIYIKLKSEGEKLNTLSFVTNINL